MRKRGPFIWFLEKIMDKQPKTANPSPELREFIEMTTKALIKSGQDARSLAEMTGTPLVVRKTDEPQPSNSVQPQNG
jgi:hypothetical protein